MVSETSDHGYPVAEHLDRMLDGPRLGPGRRRRLPGLRAGRRLQLRLGQDLSIGYMSHDAEGIELYFQESLTFLAYTDEAVVLNAG